jgi:hypothetical protein
MAVALITGKGEEGITGNPRMHRQKKDPELGGPRSSHILTTAAAPLLAKILTEREREAHTYIDI